MTIEELIAIADAEYDDGLVGQYFTEPYVEHGDTLAKFIANELQDTFEEHLTSKEQIAEAIRVMTSAIDQLENVVAALEESKC